MLQFALSRQQPSKTPKNPVGSNLPSSSLADSTDPTDVTAVSTDTELGATNMPASLSGSVTASKSNYTNVGPLNQGRANAKPSKQQPAVSDTSVADATSDQPAMGMDVGPADQRRIDEENRQLVQSMSPAEVMDRDCITSSITLCSPLSCCANGTLCML